MLVFYNPRTNLLFVVFVFLLQNNKNLYETIKSNESAIYMPCFY